MKSGFDRLLSRAKAPLSAALILLLLVVQTFAASDHLHHDLHDDAGSSSHECAATLLSNGQVDLADPGASLPIPPETFSLLTVQAGPLFAKSATNCQSSRGPPSQA